MAGRPGAGEAGQVEIDGFTAPGWEGVADAFAANFARHGEVGAAVCVYQAGRAVVDLAAGVADQVTDRAYTRHTIQPFMSVSKGVVAIAANMLADRGTLDLDVPVARYWPGFARAGKGAIPVRWPHSTIRCPVRNCCPGRRSSGHSRSSRRTGRRARPTATTR